MRGLLLVLACLTAHATAHAVPIFIETWSNPGDTAGFGAYPPESLSLHQDDGALIWGMDPSLSMALIEVGSGASSGEFTGDVAALKASYYAFDFRPDEDTMVGQFGAYIDSPDGTWYYSLPLPVAGQWTHYLLPLIPGHGHWALQYGEESLYETLTHVDDIVLEWGVAGGGGSGRLDNFEVGHTPEPGTMALVLGGAVAIILRRRKAKANLNTTV